MDMVYLEKEINRSICPIMMNRHMQAKTHIKNKRERNKNRRIMYSATPELFVQLMKQNVTGTITAFID